MAGANLSRNTDLAGKSVKRGNYTVTYDKNGYATSAKQDGGASATSTVKTTHSNDSPAHQEAYKAAQNGDWDSVGVALNKIGMAGGVNADGTFDMADANKYWQELQDEFKYNARDYYNQKYDSAYGQGSSAAFDATGGAIKTYQQLVDAIGEQAARQYLEQQTGKTTSGSIQGGGTTGGLGNGYMSFDDFLAGTGYEKFSDATQSAIRAAVQNAVNGYRDQIDTTNQESDELARQAYIAKMLGQKNLDQQMAANGYAGGMADSQRIATETDYQNTLSEIEKQRLATVKELESAITNAQLTGDMQTAQELSDYLQTIQSQWMDYVQFQQQMDNQNYWNQQNLDTQNVENARSWAMQQMAKGIMPDDEILTAAGISKQAAQQQVALALGQDAGTVTNPVQKTPKKTPGGGYNNGSLTTSQVKQLQKYLGVTADGLWGSKSSAAAGGLSANQAWEKYMGNGTSQLPQATTSGTPTFSQLKQTISGLIQTNSVNNVVPYLDKYWAAMSTSQQQEIQSVLARAGVQYTPS